MRIVLHAGAHRTATTTLQAVAADQAGRLRRQGLAVWGPDRTRRAPLAATLGAMFPPRAAARHARPHALHTLIVSDENLLGTMAGCVAAGCLYPRAAERLAAICALPGFRPCRIGLSIRRPDHWWASVLSWLAAVDPAALPSDAIDRVAASDRGWRHVIADIAAACPGVGLVVWDFPATIGDPAAQLGLLAGRDVALPGGVRARHENASCSALRLRDRLARAGSPLAARIRPGGGRWMPFNAAQRQAMDDVHAADLAWLRAGAEGRACFVGADGRPARTGGSGDGGQQGRLGATG